MTNTATPCQSVKTKIRIITDDIRVTTKIEPLSVDLIVTSPPYNVGIPYNSFDDNLSHSGYLEFSRQWLSKCYGLTKSTGRMCLNIAIDNNKNVKSALASDVTQIAQEVGWKYKTTIIWQKPTCKHEHIRGTWCSAEAPMVIPPAEFIIVFFKHSWRRMEGPGINNISREEFIQWTKGIWELTWDSKKEKTWNDHPVPFPRELPKRCIKLFSYVGDTILDPFMGSGTTLVEAVINERFSIGVDTDKEYCRMAFDRCRQLL